MLKTVAGSALDTLLRQGADTARQRAAVTLRTVKERIGLVALGFGLCGSFIFYSILVMLTPGLVVLTVCSLGALAILAKRCAREQVGHGHHA